MKTRIVILSLIIVFFIASLAFAETAKVITRENAIRNDCRFFSPVKAKVKHNDELEIISQAGDWFRVKFGNVKGCIHKSAIEKKEFSLTGLFGTKTRDTSGDEVALAGKGFNPQVESSYKKKHPELDFTMVDRIEGYTVPEKKLESFMREGGLKLP